MKHIPVPAAPIKAEELTQPLSISFHPVNVEIDKLTPEFIEQPRDVITKHLINDVKSKRGRK